MRKATPHYTLSLLLLLAGGVGCGGTPPVPEEPAVATYEGGRVTADQLDQAILSLPPAQRQPPAGSGRLGWYEKVVRGMVLDRLLLAEARAAGAESDDAILARADDRLRQAAVTVCLEKEPLAVGPPSEADLRAYYETHRDEFRRPARRQAYHIFRRVPPEGDPSAALVELKTLRARVLAGTSFQALAAELSDSETRHRQGLLGWIERGQVAPDLEQVLFSLEIGVPSEPITTREGVHLFLVKEAFVAKTFSYEEVRGLISQRLLAARRSDALVELVGEGLPEGSFVADNDTLQALLQDGDADDEVLRIGDYSLRLGDLRRQLQTETRGQGTAPTLSLARSVLDALRWRELLYRYCQEAGLSTGPDVEARLVRLTTEELVRHQLRRRLEAAVMADEARLRRYYEQNRRRFSGPLRLHVERLTVPLGERADAHMARLEAQRNALDSGELTLAAMADELGGRVEDLGPLALPALRSAAPRAASFATSLEVGTHSPPYRTEESVQMIRLRARLAPEVLSFEAAREQVRDDYLLHHGQEVLATLSDEMLTAAELEIDHTQLAALNVPASTAPAAEEAATP